MRLTARSSSRPRLRAALPRPRWVCGRSASLTDRIVTATWSSGSRPGRQLGDEGAAATGPIEGVGGNPNHAPARARGRAQTTYLKPRHGLLTCQAGGFRSPSSKKGKLGRPPFSKSRRFAALATVCRGGAREAREARRGSGGRSAPARGEPCKTASRSPAGLPGSGQWGAGSRRDRARFVARRVVLVARLSCSAFCQI